MDRRPLGFAAALYLALVLWATLGPVPWRTATNEAAGGILNPASWTSAATWSTGYFAEIAFNVAMFVPLGVLAALLLPRRAWPLAVLAGVAATTAIELAQLPMPDRVSDPRDLVANSAGALIGVVLVLAARRVRRAASVTVLQGADAGSTPSPADAESTLIAAGAPDRAA